MKCWVQKNEISIFSIDTKTDQYKFRLCGIGFSINYDSIPFELD